MDGAEILNFGIGVSNGGWNKVVVLEMLAIYNKQRTISIRKVLIGTKLDTG